MPFRGKPQPANPKLTDMVLGQNERNKTFLDKWIPDVIDECTAIQLRQRKGNYILDSRNALG
jgi:hypothetical protein